MQLMIENNIQKIVALCKKNKTNKLFVFGSILTNRFNDDSDVDLVVSFIRQKWVTISIITLTF